jgi:DNA-binding NarL/FixJ family response regulator
MNIVIIEQNKTYRESLKTALCQVNDFKVVFDADNSVFPDTIRQAQVNLLLIDYDLSEVTCNETIAKALSIWPAVRFLFLTNYKEECDLNFTKADKAILKTSSKKEFEDKIREHQSKKMNKLKIVTI